MYATTNGGDGTELADGYNAGSSHSWFSERCGKLCEAQSVPSEDAADALDNTSCELIGSVEGCPDNK
jgi:hypothetical protein